MEKKIIYSEPANFFDGKFKPTKSTTKSTTKGGEKPAKKSGKK